MLEMSAVEREVFRYICDVAGDFEVYYQANQLREALLTKRRSIKLSLTDCLEILARIGICLNERSKPEG